MPTKRAQTVLFVSSYSPFFLLTAFLGTWGDCRLNWLAAAVGVFGAASLYFFYRFAMRRQRDALTVGAARPKSADIVGYLVTYILPFVTVIDPGPKTRIGLLALIGLIGILYVRSSMFYVNPLLLAAGFRLFEVDFMSTDGGTATTAVVLSRRQDMRRGAVVSAARLTPQTYLEPWSSK